MKQKTAGKKKGRSGAVKFVVFETLKGIETARELSEKKTIEFVASKNGQKWAENAVALLKKGITPKGFIVTAIRVENHIQIIKL